MTDARLSVGRTLLAALVLLLALSVFVLATRPIQIVVVRESDGNEPPPPEALRPAAPTETPDAVKTDEKPIIKEP